MAAAAAVLLMVSTIAFFLFNKKGNEEGRMAQRQQQEFKSDIPPGGNKAVLTLQDNRVIVLNDAQNGTLAEQGGAQVVKLDDGQLAYHSGSHASSEISYNTISTPRGGQYQLTLNDGTKVWLNASSSLRFPAVFANQERRVEMTGEVYFEVARNASKPFRVNVAGKGEVEVLGTHFNINAYTDEPQVKATLLEGRVRITGSSTKQSLELLPGQQAQLGQSGQLTLNRQADTDEVMAWKNGKFSFGEGMEIEAVMRQLSRWYDVDIVYEDRVKGVLGGSMSRSVPASQVLDMLEMTGVVKFRMEGQKVIVMAR